MAADWSEGHVPGSTDVACIGSGRTVIAASGEVGVVWGEGSLTVAGLELKNALEPSVIRSLTVTGSLAGAGTIEVSGSFHWTQESTLSGTGATVIRPGATASIAISGGFGWARIAGRSFVNEGTLTLTSEMLLTEGTKVTNSGTFYADNEAGAAVWGEPPCVFLNTGTVEKAAGSNYAEFSVAFENHGVVKAKTGPLHFTKGGSGNSASTWRGVEGHAVELISGGFSLSGGTLSESITLGEAVTLTGTNAEAAEATIGGTLTVETGTVTFKDLTTNGNLTGGGTVKISHGLTWTQESTMSGSGATVLEHGATGTIAISGGFGWARIAGRTLVNEGSLTTTNSEFIMTGGAKITNSGTFTINKAGDAIWVEEHKPDSIFVNTGAFKRTSSGEVSNIYIPFENLGSIVEEGGAFHFFHPIATKEPSATYGGPESVEQGQVCTCEQDPVLTATGDLFESQTDLQVGGRGIDLNLTRAYNSQAAAEGAKGIFGYGWSNSFGDSLVVDSEHHKATLHRDSGGTIVFSESGGIFTAPATSQYKLAGSAEAGYTVTQPDQTKYKFAGASGRLETITDRNENATTLAYSGGGRLETVTDPAGRKLTFAYNGEGLVESVKDPMGHTVKYTYESSNLKTVTMPGEESARWTFAYDGSHRLTKVTDGRGGKTTNEYDSSNRVISQIDPAERKVTYEYSPFQTKITNTTTGSVTLEQFTSNDEPSAITRGYGTASATTTSYAYNGGGYLTSETDGNGHITKYGYDPESNRTSLVDANEHETKWGYDSKHDVISVTTPRGETTTIKRDSHGNAETIERPIGEATQITKYKYTAHGQVESVEDPLKHVSKYEYDANGDRTSEVNPSGDKTVREYDEDSREIATTTPRGELPGADAAIYTTQIERDAQGRPVKWQRCNSASESGATGLLMGDQTSTYSVADTTSAGYEEAFQFTAGWSGTVEELQFRTNGVANTGVTGLVLAVFADSSGKPGEVLGSATVSGTPATNSWIKASGLSVEVTAGTKYWLVALPLGSGSIHYNAAASVSAGTGNQESTTGGLGSATAESSWATYNQGPVGFQASGTTTPPAGSSTGLLTGDQTSSYSVADVTSAGHEEAFQFTAGWSGTVEELQFRTNGVANTGITGLVLAVFADSSGKPGEVLGSSTASGTPGTNSWIKASGLSISVTAGTKYWLVALPLGSGSIHYNAAASYTAGTRNDESTTGGLTTATAESSWETYNQGPVGFQANGTTKAPTYSCTNVSGSYTYDANGNLASATDPNKHTTTYTYNADNQLAKVKQANGDTTETEYDGDGHVTAQTDGNKHTTKYTRNILGQVTEVEDPLKHKTKKEYDAAGNLTKVTDATERHTTYKYDPANQLTRIEYSEEATPSVKYEYDADGNRTKMEDGTGTSKYTYDTLDRLTESKDGHGNTVKYEYDLASHNTKITYPNGKAVSRKYDSDGRLEKVEDWLEHATTFSYDANSNLKKTVFPNNEDKYAYNQADQQTRTEMKKGAETLATLAYTPDTLGQLEKVIQTGLPGVAETKYTYDENNRLTKDGANEYKYDAADNPTETPGSTNTFNEADELTKGTNVEYTYNTLGERTKRTPTSGPSSTYGYDQAGNLTKVERPEEGETAKIKDSYAYDGNGLRASQTIGATTTYMTWDPAEGLPLLLTDGTNSYIYGPKGDPVEQISSEEAIQYLHHDRQGSTRLITSTTGTVAGKCTYTAYGTPTCEGATTTALGYDGQYTSADTGLQYLRARSYDPATAQFMSSDPLSVVTGEEYGFADNSPLTNSDPTGLSFLGSVVSIGSEVAEVAMTPVDLAAEGIGDVASLTGIPEAAERAAEFWAGLATSECSSGLERALGNIFGPISELATRENIGQTTLALVPAGAADSAVRAGYTSGREFEVSQDLRFSLGNGNADKWQAQLPHYHRRVRDDFGTVVENGGIKWHRPWEKGF